MKSILRLRWYPRHLLPPEIPIAAALAYLLLLWLASLSAQAPTAKNCHPTLANRAWVLCPVHQQHPYPTR
jgi:hypothetical protein